MERESFEVKCGNGHPAPSLCNLESCLHPSPICYQQQCQHSKTHEECYSIAKSNALVNGLANKRNLLIKQADNIIFGMTDRLIKTIEALRDEYLRSNRVSLICLNQYQKQVLQLIEQKQTKDLKPSIILNSIKSLANKQGNKQEKQHLLKIKEIVDQVDKNIQKEISKIRILIKSTKIEHTTKTQLNLFSEQLHNFELISISNQQKTLKRIKQSGSLIFSLISPPLHESQSKIIRFKVVEKNGDALYFGVAKMQISVSDFCYPAKGRGVNVIGSHGVVFNHKDPSQHNKQFNFKVNEGDQVQLKYLGDSNEVKITNLSDKKEFVLKNVNNQSKNLHFSVGTYQVDQQVQIIE